MKPAATLPTNLTSGLQPGHLPALDGMRAVAVLLVVISHAGVPAPGGLGVLIFFVLSGFLITWLLLKEHERHGRISLKDFYVRRSLRIFPAFLAYATALLALLLLLDLRIVWPQVIASLLYVNNYYQAINGDPNTGFSHTWSLGIEEQFYCLWPAAFVLLVHRPRTLAKALAAAIAVLWIHRLVLVLVFDVPQGYIYEAFDTRADSLLIGCLVAVLARKRLAPRLFGALCASPAWPALLLVILAASAALETRLGVAYRDTLGLPLDAVLVGALIPQMIAFRESWVGAWLNWSVMTYLGRLSYSLYLYQQVAVGPAEDLATPLPGFFRLPIIIGVSVACAAASYYLVERPALRLKERYSRL